MANYEIITVDQLTNRAPNAYDIHWAHEANDVVEPTYACCYLTRDVARKQASRLRLKRHCGRARKRAPGVARKQASRLRLKLRRATRLTGCNRCCEEASVASAIETMLRTAYAGAYRCCEEASVASAIETEQTEAIEEVAQESSEVVEQPEEAPQASSETPKKTVRVVQFVSVLPVNGEVHKVLHEVPEEKMPLDFEVYASDTLSIDGQAVRISVVEKEITESVEEVSTYGRSAAVAESGKFEVSVLPFSPRSQFVAYRGDSYEAAKATVASTIGQCIQVWTKVDGVMLRTPDLYWDEHDQYQADWKSGKFVEAFQRDYENDEAIMAENRRRML